MMRPHGASAFVTFAPQRSATSTMRAPKTPLTPMTTSSPGSMRLTQQNSMPALPVPLIGNVISFFVRNTWRSIVLFSSIIPTKAGSRWPTSGRAMASRTDGATLLGTGVLSNGVATFTTSTLAAGSHAVAASYGGDAAFNGCTAP